MNAEYKLGDHFILKLYYAFRITVKRFIDLARLISENFEGVTEVSKLLPFECLEVKTSGFDEYLSLQYTPNIHFMFPLSTGIILLSWLHTPRRDNCNIEGKVVR